MAMSLILCFAATHYDYDFFNVFQSQRHMQCDAMGRQALVVFVEEFVALLFCSKLVDEARLTHFIGVKQTTNKYCDATCLLLLQ